jgi:hypothetical protein
VLPSLRGWNLPSPGDPSEFPTDPESRQVHAGMAIAKDEGSLVKRR